MNYKAPSRRTRERLDDEASTRRKFPIGDSYHFNNSTNEQDSLALFGPSQVFKFSLPSSLKHRVMLRLSKPVELCFCVVCSAAALALAKYLFYVRFRSLKASVQAAVANRSGYQAPYALNASC